MVPVQNRGPLEDIEAKDVKFSVKKEMIDNNNAWWLFHCPV